MTDSFVHLRVHSEYSLLDGLIRIEQLAAKCAELSQPAVALTDIANLYATVKFYRACIKQKVKPIIGCDIWLQNPLNSDDGDRVLLLCMNNVGYKNLSRLISNASNNARNHMQINWQDFCELNEGLICLFDEHQGPIARLLQHNEQGSTDAVLNAFKKLLDDRLYFPISRTGWSTEQEYINYVAPLSVQYDIPLVATNRVQFVNVEQFDIHEIRVCINDRRVLEDKRRPRNFTQQQYFRTTEEMQALFADIPVALTNTVEVAKRCNVFLQLDKNHLPEYQDESGLQVDQILRADTEKGLANRLEQPSHTQSKQTLPEDQVYFDRMDMELEVIENMGFAGYFLIVADFIKWSKENDIPVGPGRGSGAGSLVAWALGITELDPLAYGLLFERFLNPERISLPDFDVDFCVNGRDRVIEYVANRYGQDKVAQIVTFGTMAAKAVVRDVGRVLSHPYGFVDQIAKLIPMEIDMTLEKALSQEQMLRDRYDGEDDVKELIDIALQLEGIARNVGKHAGGVVISPKPLNEYMPVYFDSQISQAITQFDKDDLEAIGIVKFDFLGLRTLTILDNAVKMVNADRQPEELIDLGQLPLDDEETYQFICGGQTSAIFQLESRGMQELITQIKPSRFEDLVALIAMFRPGPLQSGMVKDFINRQHGREEIKYPHAKLEAILSETNGVILYQEQVMEIARVLAGYTLGGADVLRKAMGKKKPEEMAKQRTVFIEGAEKNGINVKLADSIFTLMDKFAGYGFNKSHSAAYALVSYQTAWMKTHYCSAYMSATLSSDMDNTDKVVSLIADCKSLGIEVRAPSINSSLYDFRPIDKSNISFGLGAIKGIGENVVQSIVAERQQNGAYQSLFDLCRRNSSRTVSKRVLEALIKSGTLDTLDANRAKMMMEISNVLQATGQQQQNEQAGQFDLFDSAEHNSAETAIEEMPVVADWTEQERLQAEKETLGLYLTGHPYNRYADELNSFFQPDVSRIDLSTAQTGIFAGIVFNFRIINTRRGKMVSAILDNGIDRAEVILFSDNVDKYLHKIQKDDVVIVAGEISLSEYSGRVDIRADLVFSVDEFREQALKTISLRLSPQAIENNGVQALQNILQDYRGKTTTINIQYSLAGAAGNIHLGDQWSVKPNQHLMDKLQEYCGKSNIDYFYDTSTVYKNIPAKPKFRSRAN